MNVLNTVFKLTIKMIDNLWLSDDYATEFGATVVYLHISLDLHSTTKSSQWTDKVSSDNPYQ